MFEYKQVQQLHLIVQCRLWEFLKSVIQLFDSDLSPSLCSPATARERTDVCAYYTFLVCWFPVVVAISGVKQSFFLIYTTGASRVCLRGPGCSGTVFIKNSKIESEELYMSTKFHWLEDTEGTANRKTHPSLKASLVLMPSVFPKRRLHAFYLLTKY